MMRLTSGRARRIAAALTLVLARAAHVHAQAPPLVVKWNNGLDIGTADGVNDFQIGALVELDGRSTPTIHCIRSSTPSSCGGSARSFRVAR